MTNTYKTAGAAKAAATRAKLVDATITPNEDGTFSFSAKRGRKALPAPVIANGVAAPREGTVGHKLWALCDDVAKKVEGKYKVLRLAIIRAAAESDEGFNDGNVRTEISLWRKHNGIAKS